MTDELAGSLCFDRRTVPPVACEPASGQFLPLPCSPGIQIGPHAYADAAVLFAGNVPLRLTPAPQRPTGQPAQVLPGSTAAYCAARHTGHVVGGGGAIGLVGR